MLSKDVTDKEIKEAVFGLGAMKAPGPDRFHGVFIISIGVLFLRMYVGLSGISLTLYSYLPR